MIAAIGTRRLIIFHSRAGQILSRTDPFESSTKILTNASPSGDLF